MDYSKRWEIIKEIGSGGQGKVFEVYDKKQFDFEGNLIPSSTFTIQNLSIINRQVNKDAFNGLTNLLNEINKLNDANNHFALKVLHDSKLAVNYATAEHRIKNEINAMKENIHPNLLKIVDVDDNYRWYVSQFYPRKTLDENRKVYIKNSLKTLISIRPLIEGVAELHKKGYIHRDIKPMNIFIDKEDNLILGDFGLIFYVDDKHDRITETYENVGSRYWQPNWADITK